MHTQDKSIENKLTVKIQRKITSKIYKTYQCYPVTSLTGNILITFLNDSSCDPTQRCRSAILLLLKQFSSSR